MYRNNRKSSFNKIFISLIIACLGIVAYGIYMYIQDVNQSDKLHALNKAENSKIVTPAEEDGIGSSESTDEGSETSFEDLDNEVADQAKTTLLQSATQEPASADLEAMTMSISFSSYDQEEQALNLGVVFINNINLVSGCSIEIQASPDHTITQTVQIVEQRSTSGCRFNNISLGSLPSPSGDNPWQITVQGHNNFNLALTSLERDVTSFTELNNLIIDN